MLWYKSDQKDVMHCCVNLALTWLSSQERFVKWLPKHLLHKYYSDWENWNAAWSACENMAQSFKKQERYIHAGISSYFSDGASDLIALPTTPSIKMQI